VFVFNKQEDYDISNGQCQVILCESNLIYCA